MTTTATPTPRPPEVNNGVTTTWVPLTTPGPAVASDCSSQIYRVPGSTDVIAFDPRYVTDNSSPEATQCLPSEVMQIWQWEQTSAGPTKSILGPFNCPSLYTSANTESVDATSTILACCPSDYLYRADSKCVSAVAPGQQVVVNNLSGAAAGPTNSATGITVTGFMITGYIFADDLVSPSITASAASTAVDPSMINNQPGVPVLLSSSPSPPSTQCTSSTSPTASHTAALASSTRLSIGAKVGITISVVFVVITAAVLLAGLHIQRRRGKQKEGKGGRKNATIIESQPLSLECQKPLQEKPLKQKQLPSKQLHPIRGADLQMALSPDTLGTFGARGQPATMGPHEMEVQEKHEMGGPEKYEMDGGNAGVLLAKDMQNADAGGTENRQARQGQQAGAQHGERNPSPDTPELNSNNIIPIQMTEDRGGVWNNFGGTTPDRSRIGSGRTTPDTSRIGNRSITPESSGINSSFGRITPDTFGGGNSPAQRKLDRFGSGNGRRPPDRHAAGGFGRTTPTTGDARLDVPGGCISPMSSTERSFLDLSEEDSR